MINYTQEFLFCCGRFVREIPPLKTQKINKINKYPIKKYYNFIIIKYGETKKLPSSNMDDCDTKCERERDKKNLNLVIWNWGF